MINFRNIFSVAKYEQKTLFRSWFFRIFSILTLFILFGANMGIFAEPGARWSFRAVPANIPYLNILFVNVAEAIIAVFLASDFLRRDKKLDTTEVIYARPISNGEYVVGKTLGILILFIGLAITVLLMSLVMNILIKDTGVAWQAYLLYPLLISIPTLVFILGLSFFLMILLRSQAVTFILLLGYIGLTLFFFQDKLFGTLDYMAFNFPMVYSDIIGFSEFKMILLQRSAYLFLGIGFIFATIRFISRLPQTGKWNGLNLTGFILFLLAGSMLGYRYYVLNANMENQRAQYLELNNKYQAEPVMDVVSNNLHVKQSGASLDISSSLFVRNQEVLPVDTILLSLNPGFKIDSIYGRDGKYIFNREEQLIFILPEREVLPGHGMRLTIHYHGKPDLSYAYLDIPERNRAVLKRLTVATINKDPAIVNENFILLTNEINWYPMAGVGFNTVNFQVNEMDFVNFTCTVEPGMGKIPVAPGTMQHSDSSYRFSSDNDLNAYSLAIGNFEKRTMMIDDVEYNLFYHPEHDFFSEFFNGIMDTIPALIKEVKDEYEYEELDLYYPFKRINLIEVPVQYHPYERPYIQTTEFLQPEMAFLPERGAGISTVDFKRVKRYEERRNRERENMRSEEEIETDIFKHFLENTFFRSDARMRGFQGMGERIVDYNTNTKVDLYSRNPFCAFPFYYSFMTGIRSSEYPAFNSMIEIYLKDDFEVSMRQNMLGGVSDNEKANLALKNNSLQEIFARWNKNLSTASINQAGAYIIMALKNKVGMEEFDNFFYYYLEEWAFRVITFEQFSSDFYDEFGVEIDPYLEFLKSANQLPEFLISTPEYYLTRDDYGDVYVVRVKITNKGQSTGLLELSFRMPGQGGFGGGGPGEINEEQRLFELKAGVTKDIQIVFYDQPRLMTINTLISGNIPSSFAKFLRQPEEKTITNLEEYEVESDEPVSFEEEGEIIIDNEDEGFSYVTETKESKIKQYIDSKKKKNEWLDYNSLNPWRTPLAWTQIAHSAMYGETIKSALISRAGDGGNIATWSTVLNEAGYYEVEVYIPVSAMYKRGPQSGKDRGSKNSRGRGRGGPDFKDKGTVYNYVVSSNEGTEEVDFQMNTTPEDGWNKLGTFHFPADTVKISLSNKTNGSRVFADAVKLYKRDNQAVY